MDDRKLKEQIITSIDDSFVPNLKDDILNKYQASKIKKTPWYKTKLFYISTPLVAASLALAIILPSTIKNNKGNDSIEIAALANDKKAVAFNLSQASNALNVIKGKDTNTSYLIKRISFKGNEEPSLPPEMMDDYTEEDSIKDVENMFTALNPYMGTVSSLIYEEDIVTPEIYQSNNENYEYIMGDLLFNFVDNNDGTYTISGLIEESGVIVEGGKYVGEYDDMTMSAISLDFTYDENKILRFTQVDFDESRTFEDFFSGESVTVETSLKYYEYALFIDDYLASFVSIDYYQVNDISAAFVNLNTPVDNALVNASVDLTLDEDNQLFGCFDLIRDNRGDSSDFPNEPFDGHHHDSSPRPHHEGHHGDLMFGRCHGDFLYEEDETSYKYQYRIDSLGKGFDPDERPNHGNPNGLNQFGYEGNYEILK